MCCNNLFHLVKYFLLLFNPALTTTALKSLQVSLIKSIKKLTLVNDVTPKSWTV